MPLCEKGMHLCCLLSMQFLWSFVISQSCGRAHKVLLTVLDVDGRIKGGGEENVAELLKHILAYFSHFGVLENV